MKDKFKNQSKDVSKRFRPVVFLGRYCLIAFFVVPMVFGQQVSEGPRLTFDEYAELYNLMFPKATDDFDPLKSEFALDVRIRPSFRAPYHLSIVKQSNGKVEIIDYRLLNFRENIGSQIAKLVQSGVRPNPVKLSEELKVVKKQIVRPNRLTSRIDAFFRPIIVPKTTAFSLDGVGYDIWYTDSGSKIAFSLDGGEDFEKNESSLITWARRMVKEARALD